MKIKMGVSPMSPNLAEKRYWAVNVIRAFGILQVIGGAVLSFFFLQPSMMALFLAIGLTTDIATSLALVLAIILGLFAGFVMAALTFAVAAAFDDLHTIRGYLRDLTITGQYYDD